MLKMIDSKRFEEAILKQGSIKDVAKKIDYHYHTFYNAIKKGYLEDSIIRVIDEKLKIPYEAYSPKVKDKTITISTLNTSYELGRPCAICEGFISMTDPHFVCERCRKKLKAFVEAEDDQ